MKLEIQRLKDKSVLFRYVLLVLGIIVLLNGGEIFNACRKVIYGMGRAMVEDRIIHKLEKYDTIETNHAVLYYTETDEEYISIIQSIIDTYYPLLLKDFQLDHSKRVTVILYPTEKIMKEILDIEGGRTPMGIYYGNTLNILSPKVWTKGNTQEEIKKEFMREGPVVHELTHLVMDDRTMGNYPIWFTEGVALYYEYKYIGFEWRRDAKDQSKEIGIKALTKDFHKLDEIVSYRRAFDLVHGLIKKYGEQKLQRMIGRLGKGQSIQKAFQEEYGFPLTHLDQF